ncbi:hypothetical protein ACP4OV_027842 [Aristida adscensionis]
MDPPALDSSWDLTGDLEQALADFFADQHYGRAIAAAPQLQMEDYVAFDEDAVLIKKYLEDPQDEKDLDKCLGGPSYTSPYLSEANVQLVDGELYSPARDVCMTLEISADPETKDYCGSSLLGAKEFFKRKEGWGVGPRGPRKKRTSSWKFPWASGTREYAKRKNNEHWTGEEVKSLVKGISKYGVGQWTKVHSKYFSSSVRTAVNLKDKWRNLLTTYTSNKKEKQARYILLPLEEPLIAQIRKLAAKYPYATRRHT